jgi:hypothetical protein
LEFLFLLESREACKLVLSIPEGIVERRTTVHPVRAFMSIGCDCVGCFIGTWKGDCLSSSSRGQPRGALPLHQVTQRQVIKFVDPTRRSGHSTCYMRYKGVCISEYVRTWFNKFMRKGVEQHLVLVQENDLFLLVIFSAILQTMIGRLTNKGYSCIGYERPHPQ